ncbi:hypothetical protein CHARACLAT_033130 [Characodon lateralis]|uniref:Uncharacterized protein n=1 Tax=Characodon lateralis TaxID=208331 RepID=A0ABU7DC51_9TELE|nr:hypothetical protein [Characodon lateralis]
MVVSSEERERCCSVTDFFQGEGSPALSSRKTIPAPPHPHHGMFSSLPLVRSTKTGWLTQLLLPGPFSGWILLSCLGFVEEREQDISRCMMELEIFSKQMEELTKLEETQLWPSSCEDAPRMDTTGPSTKH